MNPEALTILEDDRDAQRLVAVWPNVDRQGLTDDDLLADEDELILRAWARTAGVDQAVVRRLFVALFQNDICRTDGTIAPLAQQFIRKRIVDGLK